MSCIIQIVNKSMTFQEINKLMEIQYLKGRLDELYKGYVPIIIQLITEL